MRKIFLVSHGTLAKGVFEAANMIYGDLKDVCYLGLEENMGIELFKEKLNELINNSKDCNEIIVLADLKGGSPYTSAVTLLSQKELLNKSKVISGLNLPMLLTTLFMENELSEDDVEELIKAARDGIGKFEIEDEEDSDL